MKIKEFPNSEDLALDAANQMAKYIYENPSMLLCLAAGSSPTATYRQLKLKIDPAQTTALRVIKLDEWGGLSQKHSASCEHYLQQQFLNFFQIKKENYIGFNSMALNPDDEVLSIQTQLDKRGPIDLCVLGMGKNGHIAFNEPADFLNARCHLAQLSPKSLAHDMIERVTDKPRFGFTLGMADILESKMILLLIIGEGKKEVTEAFFTKKISSRLPASFLWLHPNVHCYIDQNIYNK